MTETIWHEITEINGVGNSFANHLEQLGYKYTENLLVNSASEIGRDLEHISGITKHQIENDFFLQAQFLRLEHASASIAATFAENNLSYHSIAFANPDELIDILGDEAPNVEQILRWQLDAAKRLNAQTITVKALDRNGNTIEGADVFVSNPNNSDSLSNWHYRTNEQGFALVEYVTNPLLSITIEHAGYSKSIEMPAISRTGYSNLLLALNVEAKEDCVWNERLDGFSNLTRSEVTKEFSINELEDIDRFYISYIDEERVRLSSVYRKLIRGFWRIESTFLSPSELDFEFEMNDVVKRTDEGFIKSDEKYASFFINKLRGT